MIQNAAVRMWLLATVLFVTVPRLDAADLLMEHSSQPFQAESLMMALEPWETPIEGFFIRSHHGVPNIDLSQWVLEVDGLVEKPLRLNLAELQKMEQRSFYAVLECSGNRRGLQIPAVPGVQWKKGAVGNAEWTGVSLEKILKMARVKSEARYARLEGADKPSFPGVPAFIRSVPVEKLLKEDSLVALKMNRAPLPLIHGGPARLVFPGWYGENWTKWVSRITLTQAPDEGFFMKKAYRKPREKVRPGVAWNSATGIAIEVIPVQSVMTHPVSGRTYSSGKIEVRGKAFSGHGTIAKVEVSTDQGYTWIPALVEPAHANGGWQQFRVETKVGEGTQILLSRATDSVGNQQPFDSGWNPGGYEKSEIDRVSINVADRSILNGNSILEARCLSCHSRKLIDSQRLTKSQWEGVLAKMKGFGVELRKEEYDKLLRTLSTLTPGTERVSPSSLNYETIRMSFELPSTQESSHLKDKGQIAFKKNCVLCHGDDGQGKIGPRLTGRSILSADFWSTVMWGRRSMPGFSGLLSRDEISNIQAYLRYSPNEKKQTKKEH